MKSRFPPACAIRPASRILGAAFALWFGVFSTSCRKSATPDWDTPGEAPAAETAAPAAAAPPAAPKPTPAPAPAAAPDAPAPQPAAATSDGLRFIAYNVENWLTMDRYVNRKPLKDAPKPDREKQAAIRMLARHRPDVVGLCEIGTAADLADLQAQLKAAGVDLPHSHYTGGVDPVRHLGLLSRFPIKDTAKPAEMEYQLAGKTFAINRGILDATVEARGKAYRFLGVHLKSKRDVEEGDQEAMRLNEARLLRRHVDSIFASDPNARMVVYGDFNDTRGMPAMKMVFGKHNSPTYLNPLLLKDSHQETWTQHWAPNDVYSRFDFILVSPALEGAVEAAESKIIDDAEWIDASDHRPVMATFR